MAFSLEELPVVEESRRMGRRAVADTAIELAYSVGRRTDPSAVAQGLHNLAQALEQRVFPSAEVLADLQAAAGPSYTTYFDCDDFAGYGGTCTEPCFGFAPHHMATFYCATCPEQAADPKNNPFYNWHFTGSRGSLRYADREPDVCLGRDAWKWKVGACGNCQSSAVFRCHDGWKWYPNATSPDPTICEGLVSCDNQLTLC
jgi:hypothetical protein